jgi:hypothetical protein
MEVASMNIDQLPAAALVKLVRIDAAEKEREEQNAKICARVAFCRQRSSSTDDREEYYRLHAELQELVSKHGATGPQPESSSLAASLRRWVEELPSTCTLVPVETNVEISEGESASAALAALRERMDCIEREIEGLRKAPVPPDNIKQLAREFVERAALEVDWTDDRLVVRSDADPLTLLCVLQPEQTVAVLLRQVERKASVPLPVAQRPARLRELSAALTQCEYEEEALVMLGIERGEDVCRSGWAEPQAILQVKVSRSGNTRRAA